MVRPPKPRRVVFWTENYQVGGCDKYLTDLANGINPDEWEIVFAGNPNPRMDQFVARQYAAGWPRTIVPIASVPEVQTKAAGFARTARNLVLPVRRQPRAEGESSLSGTDAHHAGALLSSLSVPVVAAVKYASRFPNRQRLGAFLQQARPAHQQRRLPGSRELSSDRDRRPSAWGSTHHSQRQQHSSAAGLAQPS